MKTFLFQIFFLLFSIYANSLFCLADEPVLDMAGEPLRSGIDYYILPVIRGNGGGLTLASISNETCPLSVVQDQNELKSGLPLTFTPVNATEGVIRESTDLNIIFSAASICVQSTLWKIDLDVGSSGQYFITTGGVEGNPGKDTISNWFKIEKYEDDYNLLYCPTVCDTCRVICRAVGIFIEDGKRRLALSDVPFKVMFKKA